MNGKILIVEDETIVALDLKMRVQALGFTVLGVAHTGEDALRLNGELGPDLVLMDINLGKGMDGIEAAIRIGAATHTPVVFITAYADPETLERARAATPYGYLVKPFEELAFRSTIEMALTRHQMERDLRAREERFRALLENGRDIIAILDPEGRLVYESPSASRTLGDGREEHLGKPIRQFIHPDDHGAFDAALRETLAHPGHTAYATVRYQATDGGWRWLETVSQNALDLPGVAGIVINARDVTERLKAEEDRHRLETQMREAQKLESLGMLAGGIAHDFNNLLMGIMGNAGLALLHLDESHPAHKRVKQIELASVRASELTNQMLAYSGKGRFLVQTLDLARLLEEMASLLQTVVSKKSILRIEAIPGRALIEADATQIRQVVMNLITNASDALGEQGGTITLRAGSLESGPEMPCLAGTPPTGPAAYLEVVDQGAGMEPETLDRIFDPFFTTKFTGRGLGLSAVLGIVRGHRGAIQVKSTLGKGTTFRLLFPLSERHAENTTLEPAAADLHGEGLVLVVDDEPQVRQVAKAALDHAGFEVLEAEDGLRALELFQLHRERIRAVLLDLTMPHMDGHEVKRRLRALDAEVPIVLTSGYSASEAEEDSRGPRDRFIQKPYRPLELNKLMVEVVRRS
ncbi:MAG TPA: response regulator [Holophagaceae bacterium]|nr:response regulator [Holophagaceae bacterium]